MVKKTQIRNIGNTFGGTAILFLVGLGLFRETKLPEQEWIPMIVMALAGALALLAGVVGFVRTSRINRTQRP